ncbi:hypothetical protein NUW54_g956 [Trametes sanguinea]|nr:hypothetical protein NUW54_g956 [Trametes sanguinea]
MCPSTPSAVQEMQDVPYGQAVGSLVYLAVATRSDIARTVRNLARFSKSPGMAHWKAVKHLFRYIKGTLDYKLTYSPSSSNELFTSYTNADHASCLLIICTVLGLNPGPHPSFSLLLISERPRCCGLF